MKKFMAASLAAVVSLVCAAGAVAAPHHPTGEWAQFADCPLNRSTIENCVYSETTGGSVTIGKKTVPIEHPVTLQGGFEGNGSEIKFFGAEDGETLSKTPQSVPGGLAGLINCKEISNFIVRLGCEATFENGLTGVNATLEVAGPATNLKLNTENLIFEEGVALELPVKVHLENPFLGSSCYVGSDSSPVVVPLTTGASGKLAGNGGVITFNKNFTLTTVSGAVLVNSTFSAPAAHGCGGAIVELLIDPLINAEIGLPAGSGSNSATLDAKLQTGASREVRASE